MRFRKELLYVNPLNLPLKYCHKDSCVLAVYFSALPPFWLRGESLRLMALKLTSQMQKAAV